MLALALATFLFWWQVGAHLWPQVLESAVALPALDPLAHGPTPVTGPSGRGHDALSLALQLSIAVLVVACPCALGLATPTAITVGSGLAAGRGLLFRGGDAIETAASLHTVLFDKTGTLTLGRPW